MNAGCPRWLPTRKPRCKIDLLGCHRAGIHQSSAICYSAVRLILFLPFHRGGKLCRPKMVKIEKLWDLEATTKDSQRKSQYREQVREIVKNPTKIQNCWQISTLTKVTAKFSNEITTKRPLTNCHLMAAETFQFTTRSGTHCFTTTSFPHRPSKSLPYFLLQPSFCR